jgi:hypothetical protein
MRAPLSDLAPPCGPLLGAISDLKREGKAIHLVEQAVAAALPNRRPRRGSDSWRACAVSPRQ